MKATFLLALLFLAGCQCPRTEAVSLGSVVAGAQIAYSRLVEKNVIQPDMAMKIAERHLNFLRANHVAKQALSLSVSGGPDSYGQAFAIAAQSAHEYVVLLLPYLAPVESIAIQQQLKAANCP